MNMRSFRVFLAVLIWSALGSGAYASAASRGPDTAGGTYRVAGRVVAMADGAVLPLVRVTLREVKNPKNVQSVLTGDDGHFEFSAAPGKYDLRGAKRGFITSAYDQHEQFSSAIVTGAGVDTANLVLKLSPLAVISGRVLDQSGDPVRGSQVVLWRENHSSGVSRTVRFRMEMTDDLGEYEFSPLDAGTYFLSASGTPWYAVHPTTAARDGSAPPLGAVDRVLDVVYPTTYYAGATESDDATPIPIRGGEHFEVDLHMVAVPALHVVLRSEQKDEQPQPVRMPIPALLKKAFDGFDPQRSSNAVYFQSPGVTEMVTAPGRYTVRLAGEGGGGQVAEVDLSQDHQELDITNAEKSSSIDVSVHISGAALPRGLFFLLRDKNRTAAYQEVAGGGKAKFDNIAAGTYEIAAGSPEGAYAVVKVAADGRESSGHSLSVPPGASLAVSLTLVAGGGSVEGFVQRGGKGVAGAMVVLIPRSPENNRDRFRRDQSDLDGSFTLRDVIPGTYTVAAIKDGWDLDWSRDAVIAKYATHGETVVVPTGAKQAIPLREPLEVQAK